jgi:hypothetical protein
MELTMTDPTPIPAFEGPHGLAYFVNPNDPTQEDRMKEAAFKTLEHGPKAWAYVTEKISEALADTPWPQVEIWHTGGGCWTLYAVRPDAAMTGDGLDSDHLIAGPFSSDPSPYDQYEASVDWKRDWEDDRINVMETAFPHPERWTTVVGDEDEGDYLEFSDLTEYARDLAEAFRKVAHARLNGRAAILVAGRQDRSLDALRTLQATVDRYLPDNYRSEITWTDDGVRTIRLYGVDHAGWTLDGYVIPRLASGLHIFEEVPFE